MDKNNLKFVIQITAIVLLVAMLMFGLGKSGTGKVATGIGTVSALDVTPKGVPAVYGSELGISYDDVSLSNPSLADATINKMAQYEDMQMNQEQMQRYISVAGSISCEYCCGAQSLIFSDGERACGCNHSYAMRGLAKYLIVNHPEMSDLTILNELGKWKTLFFPGTLQAKAEVLKAKGIDYTDYVNLASNKYWGIESGQTGGAMIGDC